MNAVYGYLQDLQKVRKGICFFDELFTSTNHEEGVSAALAVGSTLEEAKNSLTVITSHFTELSKLRFDKVCLGISDKDSKLKFTYKLEPGMSLSSCSSAFNER